MIEPLNRLQVELKQLFETILITNFIVLMQKHKGQLIIVLHTGLTKQRL